MKYDSQILKKGKHWRVLQITTDYLPSADRLDYRGDGNVIWLGEAYKIEKEKLWVLAHTPFSILKASIREVFEGHLSGIRNKGLNKIRGIW